jgi:hypothetical protein
MESKVEQFIRVMEAKIRVAEIELSNLKKDQTLEIVEFSSYLNGLNVSLRTFKIMNER